MSTHLLHALTKQAREISDAQIEAGNYRKQHRRVAGLDISVENPAGSIRSGTDPDGNEWSVRMRNHYGYIRRTTSEDSDSLDCFIRTGLSPDSDIEFVHIVNQRDPSSGKFDEHKVMIGWDSINAARKAYYDNYERGWKGLMSIVKMDIDAFKDWMKDKKATKKPAPKGLEKNAEEVSLEDISRMLSGYRESGRQSMALNSPSFAYKAVHGREPDVFIPGRGDHPQKLWKGIPVDEDIPDEVLDRLNEIPEIEGRASCSSHEDAAHPAYYVFRMNTSDDDADTVAANLKNRGLHALADVGTRGRPRVVVAYDSKPGNPDWEQWWGDLPDHIQKAVGERVSKQAADTVRDISLNRDPNDSVEMLVKGKRRSLQEVARLLRNLDGPGLQLKDVLIRDPSDRKEYSGMSVREALKARIRRKRENDLSKTSGESEALQAPAVKATSLYEGPFLVKQGIARGTLVRAAKALSKNPMKNKWHSISTANVSKVLKDKKIRPGFLALPDSTETGRVFGEPLHRAAPDKRVLRYWAKNFELEDGVIDIEKYLKEKIRRHKRGPREIWRRGKFTTFGEADNEALAKYLKKLDEKNEYFPDPSAFLVGGVGKMRAPARIFYRGGRPDRRYGSVHALLGRTLKGKDTPPRMLPSEGGIAPRPAGFKNEGFISPDLVRRQFGPAERLGARLPEANISALFYEPRRLYNELGEEGIHLNRRLKDAGAIPYTRKVRRLVDDIPPQTGTPLKFDSNSDPAQARRKGLGGLLSKWIGRALRKKGEDVEGPDSDSPSASVYAASRLTPVPRKTPSVLQELKRLKAESDRRNYPAKHAIFLRLYEMNPSAFRIDSEESDGILGITHEPTNFRFHIPRERMPKRLLETQGIYEQ